MLEIYDPYYRQINNIVSKATKDELLNIAFEEDAFIDNSYNISFFKHPKLLQHFNTTKFNCVVQMLKVTKNETKIHKDKNRYNEYDKIYMPRQTVINFPLTLIPGSTFFYDDDKNFVCQADYTECIGAILNTGEKFHNVQYRGSGEPRIVFQLCFEESYIQVCNIFDNFLKNIIL